MPDGKAISDDRLHDAVGRGQYCDTLLDAVHDAFSLALRVGVLVYMRSVQFVVSRTHSHLRRRERPCEGVHLFSAQRDSILVNVSL